MSVLIKGMEMPKEGTIIAIYKLNGKFYACVHGTELCPLVPVPTPHGRLGDLDALCDGFVSNHPVAIYAKNAPTVIEAEEGK